MKLPQPIMGNRRVLLSLLCFLHLQVAQAGADCAGTDHATERRCLERSAVQSRTELEKIYVELMKRIGDWDQDLSFKRRTSALLAQSFARFEKFRDSQCEYEASAAAGGNGAGDMRQQCRIELNERYAASLSSQLNWYVPVH